VEYFKGVLGGVGGRMVRGRRGDRRRDEEEEITRGEVRAAVKDGRGERPQEGMDCQERYGSTGGIGWRSMCGKFVTGYGEK